jgi:Uma2 family endonuclease
MPSRAEARVTPEEYLALERASPYKSEYFDGELFAMTGASRRHNLISLNIGAELRAPLHDRPCEVYTNDMRVKVSSSGLYTYPDVVVVCEEPVFEDTAGDTLLNPILLVEVLSKSTADYDRGSKFEHYRTLVSLQEYLLVAQEKPHLMHYVRQSDLTWLLEETHESTGSVHLPSIRCDLALSEVYAKVHFDG